MAGENGNYILEISVSGGVDLVTPVTSYSFGLSQGMPRAGSSGGQNRAGSAPHDLVVSRVSDKNSPVLSQYCVNGTLIKNVRLLVQSMVGTAITNRMIFSLENVIVSSFQSYISAAPNATMSENISFNFEKFTMTQ